MYKTRLHWGGLCLLLLQGCSQLPSKPSETAASPTPTSSTSATASKGRYKLLEDQGPDVDIDVTPIANAQPKKEIRTIAGNLSPYTVLGKSYSVQFNAANYSEVGQASWYGKKFHGERTSNGEIYNMFGMTAAHKSLPIPCYVRVTNLANQKSVVLRVNDRGPFHGDRIIDLTYTAAKKLDFHHLGTARVKVDIINMGDFSGAPVASVKASTAIASSAAPTQKAPAASGPPRANPQPSAANTKPPAPVVSGNVAPTYLQVGSFSTQAGAQQLQKTLKPLTHYPITLVPVGGKNLVRVLIGPFSNTAEIEQLKAQLIAKRLSNPYIVQTKTP
jgi:rare lipoprotein A